MLMLNSLVVANPSHKEVHADFLLRVPLSPSTLVELKCGKPGLPESDLKNDYHQPRITAGNLHSSAVTGCRAARECITYCKVAR